MQAPIFNNDDRIYSNGLIIPPRGERRRDEGSREEDEEEPYRLIVRIVGE
jgi:hypothetical protein